MPYIAWSNDDTRRALISSLVPIGANIITRTALSNKLSYHDLMETVRRPHWAPRSRTLYSIMDAAVILPLGYASYAVYRYGGGFDYTDTTVALALYGTNIALTLANIPLIKTGTEKNKNLKRLFINAALISATATATAVAFYKIEKTAGALMIPYMACTSFYALLGYAVWQLNPQVE